MDRKCEHGLKLEKGLRCDHGYIQVLMRSPKGTVCKNFGPHTSSSQEVASIFRAEKKKEMLESKIGIAPKLPQKMFKDVAPLWFEMWQKEKRPDGKEAHSKEACYKTGWTLNKVLIPTFGKQKFDEISSSDIYRWRNSFIAEGRTGVTANRYQSILGSIFSHVTRWVKTEQIKEGFALPKENPCEAIEKAPTRKRERILSRYEAAKLKFSFTQLNDTDGWEICKMALKSVLSMKDLKNLEIGQEIDIERSKTGVVVNIPIPVLVKLNWFGWRTRWEKARELAGLKDLQFRDLRKTGINWMKGCFDLKLISEYAGHASIKTTENSYTVKQAEYLEPLAKYIQAQVEAI